MARDQCQKGTFHLNSLLGGVVQCVRSHRVAVHRDSGGRTESVYAGATYAGGRARGRKDTVPIHLIHHVIGYFMPHF